MKRNTLDKRIRALPRNLQAKIYAHTLEQRRNERNAFAENHVPVIVNEVTRKVRRARRNPQYAARMNQAQAVLNVIERIILLTIKGLLSVIAITTLSPELAFSIFRTLNQWHLVLQSLQRYVRAIQGTAEIRITIARFIGANSDPENVATAKALRYSGMLDFGTYNENVNANSASVGRQLAMMKQTNERIPVIIRGLNQSLRYMRQQTTNNSVMIVKEIEEILASYSETLRMYTNFARERGITEKDIITRMREVRLLVDMRKFHALLARSNVRRNSLYGLLKVKLARGSQAAQAAVRRLNSVLSGRVQNNTR